MSETMETVHAPDSADAAPAEGLVAVNRCALCEGDHGVVKARALSIPLGVFSHYFMCPDRVEPVPVALLQLDGRHCRVPDNVAGILMDALTGGRWMVAVWRPILAKDGGLAVQYDRITLNFPTDKMPESIDLLEADLRKLIDPMAEKQLRRAEPDPRFRAMFRERHEG